MSGGIAILLATVIEVAELAETALASLVAGVGVTFAFSIGIFGVARYGDLRREGRGGVALMAAALAAVGLVVSAATVVGGLYMMVEG